MSTWGLLGSSDVGGCHRRSGGGALLLTPLCSQPQDWVCQRRCRIDVGPVAGAGVEISGTPFGAGRNCSELAARPPLPTPVASDLPVSVHDLWTQPLLIGAPLPTPTARTTRAGTNAAIRRALLAPSTSRPRPGHPTVLAHTGPEVRDLRSAVALLRPRPPPTHADPATPPRPAKEGSPASRRVDAVRRPTPTPFGWSYAAAVERVAVLLGSSRPHRPTTRIAWRQRSSSG